MPNFKGFSDSESFTQLPDPFFQKLLPEIDDLAELKVTLVFLWQVWHMDGPYRALRPADFDEKTLGLSEDQLAAGLEGAVRRGTLLKVEVEAEVVYFLNSPRGRAAAQAFARGERPEAGMVNSMPAVERPNVFKLYEENIGPLTPMIADMLKDAEETYSQEWVAEALEVAVRKNIRNWKYVEAILKRWKEEGRAKKQDRRNTKKDRQRDVEEKIKKFVDG